MPKESSNPGALPGTEIVAIASPFGGWQSAPAGVVNTSNGHYFATVEGVQGPISKETINNYAESDGMTLFRPERFGHMAPAHLWTQITDTNGYIVDLPLNGAMDASGQVWVVLKNGSIVRIIADGTQTANSYTPTLSNTPGYDHHLESFTNVHSVNNDILIMKDYQAPQIEWVIESWESNLTGDVNIYESQTPSTKVENWFSAMNGNTPLTKGNPHKICKGPDGNIYICDGNYLYQVSVGSGSMASATISLTLNVGADFTITSVVPYQNYVAFFAYKSASNQSSAGAARGECWLFLWNGQTTTVNGVVATDPQYKFYCPDNYANALFFDGSTMYGITSGRDDTTKIFEFSGKAFKKVFETGLLPSNQPLPNSGSLESFQDSMMMGAVKLSNAHLFRLYGGGFHDEGIITDGTYAATAIGMVKNLYTNIMYAGASYINAGSTTSYTIYYYANTDTNYQLGCQMRSILYTEGILGRRLYPLGFKGTVNRIYLYLSQWGTGAALYLSLFKDYTQCTPGNTGSFTNDLWNILIDTNTAVSNGWQTGATNYFGGTGGYYHYAYPVGTTEIDISDIAIADLSTFYVVITWAHLTTSAQAAILRRGIIYWSPSQ